MAGPWEKYGGKAPKSGPWTKYAAPAQPSQYAAGSIAPPLRSYGDATSYGLSELGGGMWDAAKGIYNTLLRPPSGDELTQAAQSSGSNPALLPLAVQVRRAGQGLGELGKQVLQVPGAIRDLYNSPDPAGTMALTAPRAAGQGAGQALAAAATQAPLGRLARTLGKTGMDAASDVPIVRHVTPRAIMKNWRATAPPAIEPVPSAPATATTSPVPLAQQIQAQQAPSSVASAVTERPSIAQQIAQPPDTSNFPTAESRAASDRAFQIFHPKGIIPGKPLDPLAERAWQDSLNNVTPQVKDYGDIAREGNPEPPRSVSRQGRLVDQVRRDQIMQGLQRNAQQIEQGEPEPGPVQGRPMYIEGDEVLDPNMDLTDALTRSLRRRTQ
jgi:hypothetical protein